MSDPMNGPRIVIMERRDMARSEALWQVRESARRHQLSWAESIANAVLLGMAASGDCLREYRLARDAERIAYEWWHVETFGRFSPAPDSTPAP